MNESNPCDADLAELLALTVEVDAWGETRYLNHLGQRHRIHGPAVITHVGDQHWYQNGIRHRTGGPAIIKANGVKWWFHNGARHRTDGPAIEWSNSDKWWFLNDQELTEKEFNERISTI